MKIKTIIKLIAHLVVGFSGMLTGILGFAALFEDTLIDGVQLPFHIAIAVFISGMMTFMVAFISGVDHNTYMDE